MNSLANTSERYMKQIPVDKYPKIFSVEFDAQYLIKMVNIFSAILSDKEANDEDLEFMLRFLKSNPIGFFIN